MSKAEAMLIGWTLFVLLLTAVALLVRRGGR